MPERQAVQKQLAARFRRGKVPGGDANPGARVESPSAAGDWDRFRDPNSLKQLQKRFQSASEAGDPDAVKIMEQIQQKLQSEKLAATMLTNMASLRMEMLMNTARAIRS
jgi:hypothetical protein